MAIDFDIDDLAARYGAETVAKYAELVGNMTPEQIAIQEAEFERVDCEDSLYLFTRSGWPNIDPARWQDGWPIEAVSEHLQAVADGEIRRLIINVPPRCSKSSVTSVSFPAWVWAQPEKRWGPTCGPHVQFLCASYAYKLALRDSVKTRRLIQSPWYQRRWGNRFKLNADQNAKQRYGNDKGGERLITSVDAGTTGEGGMIILIDDPNDASDVKSEASLQGTIDWWDGVMQTRLNDAGTGAFIIVQQRIAEDDLTGHVLSTDHGQWQHLVLPMFYEPERSFHTVIGWKDPRTERGQLLWPERFSEETARDLERRLGPWRCNPGEAPILMSDLTMKPIRDVRVGDEVVGFDKRQRGDNKKGRFKLTRTVVTEIQSHVAPVVKMTLDSGEVIRCTRDHRWYLGKDRGPDRDLYGSVVLGRTSLSRVCPPALPELTPQEQRLAGWLSGFFDGEGSVSQCRREDEAYQPSSIIQFYQGAGRNLPLCEKLEEALTHFGFEFTYSEDERKPNKNAPCYGYRNYRLKKGVGVPVPQKFLHIVQPTKWRDRILDSAYGTNFIQGREKVVSIEPDGEELVYALTTTTGNYVVWGLASSNSAGQLQQRPEPDGGGVIKRDWWTLWEPDNYPPMDYVCAYLDTAYTTKEMNDACAMTVWGVFHGSASMQANRMLDQRGRPVDMAGAYIQGAPKALLMYAWNERLELHELVTKTAETCKRFGVDLLLIENKAAGISAAQELRRLYSHEKFGVRLNDPKSQDKLARLYSVQALFAETKIVNGKEETVPSEIIYAPDRSWADMVITQVSQFPAGKHDDLVDTVSGALRHLRDIGLLTRAPERIAELDAMKQFQGRPPEPLYPG